MKKVVIVNGVARSGKDTFIDACMEKLLSAKVNSFKKAVKISTVDKVKDIAKLCGWNGETKTGKDRLFMCELKNLITKYNDGIFTDIVRQIKSYPEQKSIFFILCREPEEIQKFKDKFKDKCYSVLVRRTAAEKDIPDNDADKGVFGYNYDFTVFNNKSIDDLDAFIDSNFINSLIV